MPNGSRSQNRSRILKLGNFFGLGSGSKNLGIVAESGKSDSEPSGGSADFDILKYVGYMIDERRATAR